MRRIDVVRLDVFLQGAQQRGDQGLDCLVHLSLVGAELAGDVRHRDLVEEVVETGHYQVPPLSSCARTLPTVVGGEPFVHPIPL